jgi:hypothetical protein
MIMMMTFVMVMMVRVTPATSAAVRYIVLTTFSPLLADTKKPPAGIRQEAWS